MRRWGFLLESLHRDQAEDDIAAIVVGPFDEKGQARAWGKQFLDTEWAASDDEDFLVEIVDPDDLVPVDLGTFSAETLIEIARDRYEERKPS